MSKEIYQQFDMFTGELVDTRSRRQKTRDRQKALPRQSEMFAQKDLAQFGVKANPKLPISAKTKLELAMEDPRTDEEREADRIREAKKRTYGLPGLPEEPATDTEEEVQKE